MHSVHSVKTKVCIQSEPVCSILHTWVVEVELSSASCRSLVLVQDTVEAFLTDNLHTTMRLSVGCVLAKGSDDLLAYRRLA